MPNFPQPQRQDEPVVTDADLATLLAGTTDAVPGLRPVADVLAALTAEPSGMELAGEDRALAEFRRQAGAPVPAHRARRGTAGLTSRLGVKVGASVTAAAVVLGGGAAAAFADVLPAPIQRLAHEAIGAPFPQSRHNLPSRSRPGTHGRSGGYSRPGMRGKPAARGGPGANRQARPHATPTPTAHGNPQGQGNHGNSQGKGKGKGKEGQGSGQGNGQGQGSGQGQGNGQGNGKAKAQGNGKGQGNGQGNGLRQQGTLIRRDGTAALRSTGGRPGILAGSSVSGQSWISETSRPVPRPGCGVAAARWTGWPA
jgi:hypothetical protein